MNKKILFIATLLFTLLNFSQNQADLDTSFSTLIGFDDSSANLNIPVRSALMQPNGKVLIAGSFVTYQGISQNRIIRLNSDGTKDLSFNIGSGFNSTVNRIKLQNDGKLIVAGVFSSYNGTNVGNLIRLNNDGSIDNTFNLGIGFDGPIFAITIQNDGKFLIGGNYVNFQNNIQRYLIRLNSNGTKDSTFNIGAGFNDTVSQIVIQDDGKILVGGVFSTLSGNSQNRLVRLNSDGSKDATFNIGTGFNFTANSISIQSDLKIIVGGDYSSFNGLSQKYLVRLNADGTKDNSFNIGIGFDDSISSVILLANGQVLVGGKFSTYNGLAQNKLIKLNSNGSKDQSFDIGNGFGGSFNTYGIYNLNIFSNGKILVGGKFTNYQGITTTRDLCLLKGDASLSNSIFINTDFNIYPNPVNQTLNITNSSNATINSIEVFNLQGKLVAKLPLINSVIDVSTLKPSIYLLKINSNINSYYKKFIKN